MCALTVGRGCGRSRRPRQAVRPVAQHLARRSGHDELHPRTDQDDVPDDEPADLPAGHLARTETVERSASSLLVTDAEQVHLWHVDRVVDAEGLVTADPRGPRPADLRRRPRARSIMPGARSIAVTAVRGVRTWPFHFNKHALSGRGHRVMLRRAGSGGHTRRTYGTRTQEHLGRWATSASRYWVAFPPSSTG